SIHIASSLSNMINAARLASDEFKESLITVFDPGQISLGTGLVVKKAADLVRQDLHLNEIIDQLKSFSKRVHSFASLDTLEFLRRSGRLSRLQYALGSFLQLKPIIFIHDGVSEIERVRTRSTSYHRVIEMVKALGPLEQLAVIYTRTYAYGEQLLAMAAELIPTGIKPIFTEVTPVIGVHVGPDAAGLVAVLREPAV
ncbi:MAG TPA: DegV family protein, partial [Longilinea sp.]|nr:DegV family protein [Longilinea sp.]